MKNKLTVEGVMHVDKKGTLSPQTLHVTFDPVTREFGTLLPKHLVGEGGPALCFESLNNLIEAFEDLMNEYQRKLLLAGAEEVIWVRVMSWVDSAETSSVLMQASSALVRRDPVTKLITHATSVLNGSPAKAIPLDKPDSLTAQFFLAKTAENEAKVQRLLASIRQTHVILKSVADRGELEWQPAFDSIIEMHSTMVPANQVEAVNPEPVQQSLPLDDEEL